MTGATASIYVTKLAAAHRQLRAAVRLFFLDEDELAVHTVIAAAHGLITDLKKQLGHDEVGDFYRTMIFYVVRDFQRGVLPKYFHNNQEFMASIKRMADKIPELVDENISDFKVEVPEILASEYWQGRKFAANFLKHADRDPRGTLTLDRLQNIEALTIAYGSYSDLVPIDRDSEGYVLSLYLSAVGYRSEGLSGRDQELVDELRQLESADRKRCCYELILKMNRPE